MRAFLVILMLISLNSLGQENPKRGIPKAKFKTLSSQVDRAYPQGVSIDVHCILKDNIDGDHTVIYSLADGKNSLVLSSTSRKDGRIGLNFYKLNDIRYLIIGGPSELPRKIDLVKLKGQKIEIELVVEPNTASMY